MLIINMFDITVMLTLSRPAARHQATQMILKFPIAQVVALRQIPIDHAAVACE